MSSRKEDHISLALQSGTPAAGLDRRFDYDPVHGIHPREDARWPVGFAGFALDYPVWISSMTGGAVRAGDINSRLAQLCGKYKLGMGLGSCRKIIEDPACAGDFQVRKYMGAQPLFANLGIAQCAQWLQEGRDDHIKTIMDVCEADGLIIHLNPLQEYMQPEGDRFRQSPLVTLLHLREKFSFPMIVKEVGQGISRRGLEALMKLDLAAIEFGAFGGTNFALLELLRDDEQKLAAFEPMARVGHSAEEMVHYTNAIIAEDQALSCRNIIISGGVSHFLDAYYLLSLSRANALYGMASAWLKHAIHSYEELDHFFTQQMQGLMLAKAFLRIRE
ncbi:MAG: isopentenyl-diphosphate delta-isomerase [Saprospiraceae bacterium]|nr:isopentenyl-diphosphate delta-isomerase [Saprospiraceae bacterium]HMW40060.1 isopentenyl-diphosphate delta-isomerase [Saprospiraceae bacterium]HMX88703.1 isopentenyl-diphosphate delta-isomerase [Saprospiraceae bacterium]HMZ40135.1 isopentenyl-diphosphate delta-isomerase [Saprospiraceae bacterium]HNB31938.1 isopentenyl-diphosphate delta-isomerase [Saprospiraceae bacterium]